MLINYVVSKCIYMIMICCIVIFECLKMLFLSNYALQFSIWNIFLKPALVVLGIVAAVWGLDEALCC